MSTWNFRDPRVQRRPNLSATKSMRIKQVRSAMNYLAILEAEIAQRQNIAVHPHRFSAREFLFGKAEVGHIQCPDLPV